MEDGLKISELTQATTINDSDLIPIVQNNETKSITKEDLMADTKALIDRNSAYSTTEQIVGTWVNNKPIYRKVYSISGDMTASAWTTLVSISNVDTLLKGLMGGSANNCVWNDVDLRVVNDNLQYYCPLTHAYSWTIIEYTKTTD